MSARAPVACVVLVLLAACAEAPHRPSPKDPRAELVLQDGRRILGEYVVGSLRIPRGAVVIVAGDLVVRADGPIVIEGTLRAVDRGENGEVPEQINAPRIDLSASTIEIAGDVIGGSGRSFVHEPLAGGRGTSVLLRAERTTVKGILLGGAGGDSGPGQVGGAGGDVVAFGAMEARGVVLGGDAGHSGVALEGRAAPRPARAGSVFVDANPSDPRWK